MPLNRWVIYAEGSFCEDSAGCRRRALAQHRREVSDLQGTLIDLHKRLSFYEDVEHPGTEPDEPAERM